MTAPAWFPKARDVHLQFLERARDKGELTTGKELRRFFALAIAGEAGELANLLAKDSRGDNISWKDVYHEVRAAWRALVSVRGAGIPNRLKADPIVNHLFNLIFGHRPHRGSGSSKKIVYRHAKSVRCLDQHLQAWAATITLEVGELCSADIQFRRYLSLRLIQLYATFTEPISDTNPLRSDLAGPSASWARD